MSQTHRAHRIALAAIAGLILFAPPASAATLLAHTTFDSGTLEGWSDAEIDEEAPTFPGLPRCSGDYPPAIVVPSDGAPAPAVHKGPEDGNGLECFVGIARTFTIAPGSSVVFSFDARATSGTPDSSVTNVYYAVLEGPALFDPGAHSGDVLASSHPVAGGTTDTGWLTLGPYTSDAYPAGGTVTVFLGTSDAWTDDHDKTIAIDNVFVWEETAVDPVPELGALVLAGSGIVVLLVGAVLRRRGVP